ncbi:MAG: nitrophenyl compound nitroreductase subunit ArsF family protein [Thermodesulfobacteriota bacterium]
MKHGALFKTIAAILFSGLFLTLGPLSTGVLAGPDEAADKTPEYVAYYFYTSKRCGPCTRIEKWSRDAIKQNFKDEIDAGKLQWRAINVEKPDNKHFIQDFKLYTKSVIIAEYRNGEAVRWENLEKVWNLYQDKEKYFDYVAGQTRTFMESS